MIKYTEYKLSFQPFLRAQSVTSGTFTFLCNRHHHPVPERSHLSKLKLCAFKHLLHTPPSPFPVPMNLTPPGASRKWSHTALAFWGLACYLRGGGKIGRTASCPERYTHIYYAQMVTDPRTLGPDSSPRGNQCCL